MPDDISRSWSERIPVPLRMLGKAMTDIAICIAACTTIINDRELKSDRPAIMITLEGVVAMTLLCLFDNDHKKAALMLNEGLLQGVESRLMLSASRRKQK